MLKTGEHTRGPDQEDIEPKKIVHSLKTSAVQHSETSAAQLVSRALRDVPSTSGVLAKVPDRPTLQRLVNRMRQATLPPNPKSVADLGELLRDFTVTDSGELLLLYDKNTMDGEGRILVFATKENLRTLFKSRIWFADGTFKTAPDIFLRLFTTFFACTTKTTFHSCMPYALLENKLELSYTAVLQAVKAMTTAAGIHVLDPQTVIADFEVAIINAVKFELPNANLRLCFYHLGQSTWKSVQEHGLQADYINTKKNRA